MHTDQVRFLDLNNDGTVDYVIKVDVAFSASVFFALIANMGDGPHAVNGKSISSTSDFYPYVMNPGDVIDGQANWLIPRAWTTASGQGIFFRSDSSGYNAGYWGGVIDRFVGLRMELGGNFHYGWIRLNVLTAKHAIIKDYAFNAMPNDPILAGEGIPLLCTDPFEPNNNFSQAATLPFSSPAEALIQSSGDKDFFRFIAPSVQNNIRITLSDMPKNYNVFLYDQNHALIGESQNLQLINDTIIFNNITPLQPYFIVVRGKNMNTFANTDCYTLLLEKSNTPFRIGNDEYALQNFTVSVSPNPVSDIATIAIELKEPEKVSVGLFSTDGKMVRSISNDQLPEGLNEISFDATGLPAGLYFLQVQSTDGTIMKKIMVE